MNSQLYATTMVGSSTRPSTSQPASCLREPEYSRSGVRIAPRRPLSCQCVWSSFAGLLRELNARLEAFDYKSLEGETAGTELITLATSQVRARGRRHTNENPDYYWLGRSGQEDGCGHQTSVLRSLPRWSQPISQHFSSLTRISW